jgi:two-component system sensor histidine kinase AlgZ
MGWLVFLTPAVIALLLEPLVADIAEARWAGQTVTTALYAVILGVLIQQAAKYAEKRFTRPPARLAAMATVTLLTIGICAAISFPYIALSLQVRALAIASIFLATGCGLGRARMKLLDERTATLEAKLQTLQARTNPHFLFNSLTSVSALIARDPDKACVAIEQLSGLFRYSLESSTRLHSTLREELDIVRDYVAVETLRLGDTLTCDIDVDEALLDCEAPPMLLQPLVENAIRHGVEQQGGAVTLRVRRDADAIELCIHNRSGAESSHRGANSTLSGIITRLAFRYGDRASLATRRDDGFVVTVRLPVIA